MRKIRAAGILAAIAGMPHAAGATAETPPPVPPRVKWAVVEQKTEEFTKALGALNAAWDKQQEAEGKLEKAAKSLEGTTGEKEKARKELERKEAAESSQAAAKGSANAEAALKKLAVAARLKDSILLRVQGLAPKLNGSSCEAAKIVLYLDDRQFPKHYGSCPNPEGGLIRFDLDWNADSGPVWQAILKNRGLTGELQLLVTAGPEGERAWPSDEGSFPFERIHRPWLYQWVAFFLAFSCAVASLSRNSYLLRDSGTVPAGQWPAYSLAKVQMLWWTFWIAIAFALLYMITWQTALSTGAVILMGISGLTGLAAVGIDDSKVSAAQAKLQVTAAGTPEHAEATAAATAPVATGNFFKDIVSDGRGVSPHRVQLVLWTLILTVVFVAELLSDLKMREFDTNLLTLMGISSGIYVGFKYPEKRG